MLKIDNTPRVLPVSVTLHTTILDKAELKGFISKKERRFLRESAKLVADRTRGSLRKGNRAAPPGQPPTSRTGKLKKLIRYGVDSGRIVSTVGAIPMFDSQSRGTAPRVLEYGGLRVGKTPPPIKMGKKAPVAVSKTKTKGYVPYKNSRGEKFYVKFAAIKTQKQLEAARTAEKKLNGQPSRPGFVEARPYLNPALASASPIINRFFK